MRSISIIFSAMLIAGCGSMPENAKTYHEYTLTHKNGHTVNVTALLLDPTGWYHEDVMTFCPGIVESGDTSTTLHGCAKRNKSQTVCIYAAPYPIDGFTQAVVDHEEAHCMGWEHEDDMLDPVYIKAKRVGL